MADAWVRRAPRPLWLAVLALACTASPACAAFPGSNGRIAFTEYDDTGGLGTGGPAVSVQSVLPGGSGRRAVIGRPNRENNDYAQPSYSPDGRHIAVASFGAITLARADGRKQRAITGPRSEATDSNPDWSPSGRRIVFQRHLDFFDVTDVLRIYHHGHSRTLARGSDPAWSVTGWITYVGKDGQSIYRIRPDGSHRRRVASGRAPDWSPDGGRIVFTVGEGRLRTVNPDGSHLQRLTGHFATAAAYSPDGAWIVYSEGDAIYVLPANGGPKRLLVRPINRSSGFLDEPDWQPLAPADARTAGACRSPASFC
jgi:Tol biopolymer transport system component